jgi:CDP-diacylglycerol--glycerol-3-phosphate 3-phosphatidyltransferase
LAAAHPRRVGGLTRVNLPNKLTLSRFVLTVLFVAAVFWHSPVNDTVALVLFCIAGLTDYFDGRIARERNLITNFGVLMDPLADKILICSAFIALVERAHLPDWTGVRIEAWMAILIVARELAITGLRLLAATKNLVLAAEGYGKHKTISQITAVIAILVMEAYPEWGQWPDTFLKPWVPLFATVALWLTVILTVSSGLLYLWNNRKLFMDDL